MPTFVGLLLVSLFAFSGLALSENNIKNHSFAIDYENDQFLLDGEPFRYVSGSFHYFRTPKQHWRDILRKMRAGGLNAISTYVEWSMHEPEFDQWVWDGDADIVEFIKMAQEEDLFVILRPGPYICAERDFGGFPYWLLSKVPDIKLRTKDERYIFYAERFLNELLERTRPLLRGNGGPIIMVQVENEYGSFYSCDDQYKSKMHEIFHRHVEENAVLFTTDGPARNMLRCGSIPGVYATIDFGSGANVPLNYKVMREFTPKGPLVNSEYYPGWLTHWGENFQRVDSRKVAKTLDEMLAFNVSVNIYMYYGGTNFAFTSGANINSNYWPQLTSYDYDAPLTEAGDPTPKYFELRDVIQKYLPLRNIKTPEVAPKRGYGIVTMEPKVDLFSKTGRQTFGSRRVSFLNPPTFESLNQKNFLVLYEADLPVLSKPENVTLNAVTKDRGHVYANKKLAGIFNRMDRTYSLSMSVKNAKNIKILVEDMGHVNFGSTDVEDFKGIFNVTLNGSPLTAWKATGFKLASVVSGDLSVEETFGQTGPLHNGPQLLEGRFVIDGELFDTYLNTQGWGKGVAYINGFNLGRYWPVLGPQGTLYVPSTYLKIGTNSLVLLEQDYVPKSRTIKFQTKAILDF